MDGSICMEIQKASEMVRPRFGPEEVRIAYEECIVSVCVFCP